MDIREDLNIYMQIIRLLDESVNGYLYAFFGRAGDPV